MKQFNLILLLLIVPFCGQAQKDSVKTTEKVSFELLRNQPNFTWVSAGLSYDLSMNPFNITMIALGADANIKHEKFNFNFHSRMHFAEGYTDKSLNGKPSAESIYEPENSRDIGFDFTYFIKHETKRMEHEMTLRHKHQQKTNIFVSADRSYRWGVDFGLMGGSSYYNFGNASLLGVDQNGNSAEITSNKKDGAVATYLNQIIIRLGASTSSTLNFKIRAEKYGTKYQKEYNRFYFHGLIGVAQSLDDVLVPIDNVQNLKIFTRYNLNENVKRNPIGFAAGYEYFNMKKAGLGWIAEFGLQPGPRYAFGNNFYLNLKLRIHLGMMLK